MKIIKDFENFISESYALVKAKDIEDMTKQFAKKYKITENDIETLLYVVHSDDHVATTIKRLITKLQKNGELPKIILYRGCSDAELNSIKDTGYSIVDTLSFSEDKNVAKGFGKNIIEIEAEVPMFCYHKFYGEWYTALKEADPDEYDSVDGDYMIESAEEELEWICTNDYKFVPDGDLKFKLVNK